MPKKIEHTLFITMNEAGSVCECDASEAQAELIVYTLGDQIVDGHVVLINEELTEEESEGVMEYTEGDRQLDLFDRFSNPRFGSIEDLDG